MNLLELSDLLRQLVVDNESVTLPGMGCFKVEERPSELLNEGRMITPPSRKIVFDSSDSNSNNLLVQKYSRVKNISENDAAAEVAGLLRQMKKELVENAKVEIPDFGVLCFGEAGSFVFEAAPDFDFESDSYSLEPLSLQKRSEVSDIDMVEVVEMADILEECGDDGMQEVIEIVIEDNGNADSIQPEQDVIELTETDDAETDRAEAGKTEEDELEMGGDKACESELLEEPQSDAADNSAKTSVGIKILAVAGIVAALIVVLVVLMVLFKDSLMPLLEQLLYSDEELQILRGIENITK